MKYENENSTQQAQDLECGFLRRWYYGNKSSCVVHMVDPFSRIEFVGEQWEWQT